MYEAFRAVVGGAAFRGICGGKTSVGHGIDNPKVRCVLEDGKKKSGEVGLLHILCIVALLYWSARLCCARLSSKERSSSNEQSQGRVPWKSEAPPPNREITPPVFVNSAMAHDWPAAT